MALDEALLEAMPRLGHPVLRFYGWIEKAASFGYFQKFADVERMTLLRPLVRRPTAGGLVAHDADFTYGLIFPTNDPWYSLSATESYRRVHEWIQRAFTRLNIATELAERRRDAGGGQCFVGYEKYDVLSKGRKIAGAAQRRRRDGLLIQGSVQPPNSIAEAEWHEAMCQVPEAEQGIRWVELEPDSALKARAAELAQRKYSQAVHNQKR